MPITGSKKKQLTMDAILDLITPYDIYRYYFGDFQINHATVNHLRGDRNPSFIIGNKYGELSHFDFGDSNWRGDCFSLVMQKENCDLNTALHIIDRDFGLGISTDTFKGKYKEITSAYKQPEITKKNTLIQIITRKFTKEELAYWNQYHIDISELRENNVYSIKTLFFNKSKFPLKETDIRFGYYYEGFWKIYRPMAGKDDKWFPNNVPITMMDGKHLIKDCDTAFINKSKKDYMVVSKIFKCSCGVQNEGIGCFSPENVEYLKSNSRRQILSFDADGPGVKNSQYITKLFGFDYCNVPKKYLQQGLKDWADVAKIHGLKEVEKILTEKNLL